MGIMEEEKRLEQEIEEIEKQIKPYFDKLGVSEFDQINTVNITNLSDEELKSLDELLMLKGNKLHELYNAVNVALDNLPFTNDMVDLSEDEISDLTESEILDIVDDFPDPEFEEGDE